jgi:endonuclease-3
MKKKIPKKFPRDKIGLLEEKYSKYWWSSEDENLYQDAMADPFKNIVFTILSQNTTNKNTMRAYVSLVKTIDITPEVLSKSNQGKIAKALKPGGLQNLKAKRLINLGKTVMERWNGDMSWIYKVAKDELRKSLMEINGVGDKTADVMLTSLYGEREAFVVDTHMRRIAIRLGLVGEKAGYNKIQLALTDFLPWDELGEERLAGLFWLFAKYTCDARKPRCYECILNDICEKNIVADSG